MKNKVTYEMARREDIPWIAQAQVAMAKETESLTLVPATVQAGVTRVFDEPQRGFYIVARDESGSPAGCLMINREWSDWRAAEVWWIHSVYIAPEFRKTGIFTGMYQYVEQLAREHGARGIRLYVDRTNENAIAVYRRLGMIGDHYQVFERMF